MARQLADGSALAGRRSAGLGPRGARLRSLCHTPSSAPGAPSPARGEGDRTEKPQSGPSAPCGRRWRAAPDEGYAADGRTLAHPRIKTFRPDIVVQPEAVIGRRMCPLAAFEARTDAAADAHRHELA